MEARITGAFDIDSLYYVVASRFQAPLQDQPRLVVIVHHQDRGHCWSESRDRCALDSPSPAGKSRTMRLRWHAAQRTSQTAATVWPPAMGVPGFRGDPHRGHSRRAPGVTIARRMRSASSAENGWSGL